MIEFGGNVTREQAIFEDNQRCFKQVSNRYGYETLQDERGPYVHCEAQEDFFNLMEILVKEHFDLRDLQMDFGVNEGTRFIQVFIKPPTP
jgi:hypothetical protein